MKKWLGMISSAVAGVFGIVFLFLAGLTMRQSSLSESISGFNLLKEDVSEITSAVIYKIFTIVLIVVAILLIVWSFLLLLNNLKVLKLKFNSNIVTVIGLAIFAVCAIVGFISLTTLGGEIGISSHMDYYGPGVGTWLNLVVGVLACACGVTSLVLNKKK